MATNATPQGLEQFSSTINQQFTQIAQKVSSHPVARELLEGITSTADRLYVVEQVITMGVTALESEAGAMIDLSREWGCVAAAILCNVLENGGFINYHSFMDPLLGLPADVKPDPRAIYCMGRMHELEVVLPVDLRMAIALYHYAADLGYEPARDMLLEIYSSERYVFSPADLIDNNYYESGALRGDVFAQTLMGIYCYYTSTEAMDTAWEQSGKWLQLAAKAGNRHAMHMLGSWYRYDPKPQSLRKAFPTWERAAKLGSLDAELDLALCYYDGELVPADRKRGMAMLESLCQRGLAYAQSELGHILLEDKTVTDKARAVELLQQAADNGNSTAQHTLAGIYYDGRHVPRDLKRAAGLWRKAAQRGNYTSAYDLAMCYAKGEGVRENPGLAFMWMSEAANAMTDDFESVGTIAGAQHELAHYYLRGYGTKKDRSLGLKWLKLSAENGDHAAQQEIKHLHSLN